MYGNNPHRSNIDNSIRRKNFPMFGIIFRTMAYRFSLISRRYTRRYFKKGNRKKEKKAHKTLKGRRKRLSQSPPSTVNHLVKRQKKK